MLNCDSQNHAPQRKKLVTLQRSNEERFVLFKEKLLDDNKQEENDI